MERDRAEMAARERELAERSSALDHGRPPWRSLFDRKIDVSPVREGGGFAFRASYEDRVVDGWGQYLSVLVLTTTTQGGATVSIHPLGRSRLAGCHVRVDGVGMPWQYPDEADARLRAVWRAALSVFEEIALELAPPSTSVGRGSETASQPTGGDVLGRL